MPDLKGDRAVAAHLMRTAVDADMAPAITARMARVVPLSIQLTRRKDSRSSCHGGRAGQRRGRFLRGAPGRTRSRG